MLLQKSIRASEVEALRTIATTEYPALARYSTTCPPTSPLAPVTATFGLSESICSIHQSVLTCQNEYFRGFAGFLRSFASNFQKREPVAERIRRAEQGDLNLCFRSSFRHPLLSQT